MIEYNQSEYQQNPLGHDTTDSIKGLLSIIIMIHHITFYVKDIPSILKLIWYIAFPLVGLFFFFSSYGLFLGMAKDGYWANFYSKRFSRVLFPYLLVAGTWAIIEIAQGGGNKPLRILINAFSIRTISPMWYVWVIMGSYVLFYCVFKHHTSTKKSMILFDFLVLEYCVISAVINPREEMYASVIGLCVGIHFANRAEEIEKKLNNRYMLKTVCIGVLFMLLFCIRLLLSLAGLENRLIQTCLRNIITLLFISFVICIIQKLRINKPALMSVGKISYEIYLIHPFVLYSLDQIYSDAKICLYNFVIIFGTFFLTVILSVALNRICRILKYKRGLHCFHKTKND